MDPSTALLEPRLIRAPLALCLLAAGCGGAAPAPVPPVDARTPAELPPRPGDPPSLRVAQFLGTERLAVLAGATRAESFRIESAAAPAAGAPVLRGYPILRPGPDCTPAQLDEFRRLALDAGNYDFERAKGCEFMPGVGLRLHTGERTLDVLLCFSCDEWEFWLGDARVIEDFDPARPALLRLAQALFPDDAALQGLSAARR